MRVWGEVGVIRHVQDDKACPNEAANQTAQGVAVLARGLNGRAHLAPIVDPLRILDGHLRSVQVRQLEGVPFAVPIRLAQAESEGIGTIEIVESAGSENTRDLLKHDTVSNGGRST